MIRFVIYGVAVPQGRPRVYRRGNHIGFYDPKTSRSWKEMVKWQVIEQYKHRRLLDSPIKLTTHFYMPRPKSLPKRIYYHIRKPDLDNLLKGVKDALKGIVYRDDSQIIRIDASKEYGDPPRVEVAIEELSCHSPNIFLSNL